MGVRICGWCRAELGPAPAIEGETTGICDPCAAIFLRQIEERPVAGAPVDA
jgi:hypothetical protein